jgi:hypothetical protein
MAGERFASLLRVPGRTVVNLPGILLSRLEDRQNLYWLLLEESHLTRGLFACMLRRVVTLRAPAG